MNFKLLKKDTGPTLTKFHVLDSAGAICGSINVPNQHVVRRHLKSPGVGGT